MFRIAVYDVSPDIEAIRSLLDKYKQSRVCGEMNIFYFETVDELLQDIEDGEAYDLYILGVHEPRLDGIELAKNIRVTDENASIIFIASSREYAYDSYRLSATQYFLKPVPETELFPLLDKIVNNRKRNGNEIFLFPAPDSIVKVLFSNIEHIEIYDHKITAHLVDGTDMVSKTIRTSFAEAIAPLLADSRFLQIHRSFAVNMEHVREMVSNTFVMTNGSAILIPRSRVNSARAEFFKWMSQHGVNIPVDKKGKVGRAAKRSATISIIVLLILTAILNFSPKLSAAAYEIPIIGDIVRVLTLNRFAYEDKGYSAEINVPEIRGLLDAELEERLNAEFREFADDLIRSFEESIVEIGELGTNVEETSGEPAHMSIKADYEVKTDNDRVLAVDVYMYSDVGNFVNHRFYTIDKRESTLVRLTDIFRPGTDYITPISVYLTAEMERINNEEDGAFMLTDIPGQYGYFCQIQPDNKFYISDNGQLIICFDKYEVAAGFMGSPEFVIPIEVITDIISTDLIR